MNKNFNVIEVVNEDASRNNEVFPDNTIITFYNDSSKIKISDGKTPFNSLPYVGGGEDVIASEISNYPEYDSQEEAASLPDYAPFRTSTGEIMYKLPAAPKVANFNPLSSYFSYGFVSIDGAEAIQLPETIEYNTSYRITVPAAPEYIINIMLATGDVSLPELEKHAFSNEGELYIEISQGSELYNISDLISITDSVNYNSLTEITTFTNNSGEEVNFILAFGNPDFVLADLDNASLPLTSAEAALPYNNGKAIVGFGSSLEGTINADITVNGEVISVIGNVNLSDLGTLLFTGTLDPMYGNTFTIPYADIPYVDGKQKITISSVVVNSITV